MIRSRRLGLVVLAGLAFASDPRPAHARGFGGGGFRGGGGGFRGGSFGGGGIRGYGGGGFGGSRGGFDGYRGAGGFEGARGGYGGASAYRGNFGGEAARTPSFGSAGSFDRGESSFRGYNPYASGGMGREGSFNRGGADNLGASGSGSYTGPRGTTVDYGGAGRAGTGPNGGAAAGGIGGMKVTTPGGRSVTDVGRAGAAVGPNGGTAAGRANTRVGTGPNGTGVEHSREGGAIGPNGNAVAGRSEFRGAAGANGAFAERDRGGVAAGSWGAAGYRSYGAAGFRPYGYNAYAGYHAGWVHGYWNGHGAGWYGWHNPYWGAWGLGMATGLGWGLSSWGFGSALYGMGYAPYVNPYYVFAVAPADANLPYDYTQPIDTVSAPAADDVTSQAVAVFDAARESFHQGQYDQALSQADQALAKTPNDTALHEFRALCLFALKRYDEAAGVLYAVLSVGPGWDWATLIGLYPDVDTYTTQLRALESTCESIPKAAGPRFVLAYHYLAQGHTEAARAMYQQIVALSPTDTLSARLLKQLTPPAADAPAATTATEAAPASSAVPAGATIEGTWTARPTTDTTIGLTLGNDGKFTWNVTKSGKSRQFAGKSTYGDGLLTLAQDNGPVLVGRVSWTDAQHMTFRIAGDGPDDPGLSFGR